MHCAGSPGRTTEHAAVGCAGSLLAGSQQRRLLASLEMLAGGRAVTAVAMDLGYDSPSAFIAMFKRVLGKSPTAYLSEGVA